jgi:hypothetical protein
LRADFDDFMDYAKVLAEEDAEASQKNNIMLITKLRRWKEDWKNVHR